MRYRAFGKLDWASSVLGFGIMRLPILDGNPAQINDREAIPMVRYAVDHGVNYLDSGYTYHGKASEVFLGRVLRDGYRQVVRVATKLPTWLMKAPEDFDRFLNEQLARLQTDHIDFYLLHELNAERWPVMLQMDVLRSAERALADGRIRHFGFSFHDRFEVFKEIIDSYDRWEFCQIQYNYMDEDFQAGTKGLEYAAAKGLGVVVMEPVRGGQLARKPPQVILDLWETSARQRSPAEWALQWIWNRPEVSVVLSGMSTMEQVVENVAAAGASGPHMLTTTELGLVGRVRDQYRELSQIACTACKYCQPCPSKVNIPGLLQTFNDGLMYNDSYMARRAYRLFIPDEAKANLCTECGECETKCPQHLPIQEWLAKAHEALSPGTP